MRNSHYFIIKNIMKEDNPNLKFPIGSIVRRKLGKKVIEPIINNYEI